MDATVRHEMGDAPEGLTAGLVVGPYTLVRPIGSGGMGAVWLALREDGGEPPEVALKVLRSHLAADADARQRFLREARAGRTIQDQGVVRTLDAGIAELAGTERPWLAMELVEGRTLRDLMRSLGRVPEPLLRDMARQAALALEAVHAAGLVHRDLKPGNVIITGADQVRLMDLGAALEVADDARLTRAGVFVGTLLYAAPEQFGQGAIGPATDLYALGAVLYEAITGVQPFDAEDVRGVLRRHLDVVPDKCGLLNPQVSPFFEELIACLLEKDPSRRPGSAAELAAIVAEGESSAWWTQREHALRAAHPRGELRRARLAAQPPLVGRQSELQRLRAAVSEARAGRGRIVVIEGEAGVGKSRLLDALACDVDATSGGMTQLVGASPPGDLGAAHGAIAQALVAHFGVHELRAALGRFLQATPRLVPAFHSYVTAEPLPAGEPPLSSEGLAAALCAVARGLCAREPVLWVIEDLHLASADGRALALALARIASELPLALVITSRPETPEADEISRLRGAERIVLPRLSAAEVVQLLAGVLASEAAAERLGGKVARKTDGNPFFVLEMVSEMKVRGLLTRADDGSWRATGEIAAMDVPSSVRDFLAGRLKGLSDPDRALLDVASVHGFHFDPDLVARVLDRRRLDVLQAFAAVERRTGVIRATGAGFQFDHHQMQEIVHQAIPPVLRMEYHALLADAWVERAGFEGRPPEGIPRDAACFLAEHFLAGGRRAQGVALALPALAHLMNRSEAEAACELATLALQAAEPDDDATRCDILLQQSASFAQLARRSDDREAARAALAAARRLRDPRREAQALVALGHALTVASEYREAREVLERACELAARAGDRPAEVRAKGALGGVMFRLGDYAAARRLDEEFVEGAREMGDPASEAAGLGQLGTVLSRIGDDEAARAMFEWSCVIARQIGRRRLEAQGLLRVGMIHLNAGEHDEAVRCLDEAGALSRDLGYGFGLSDAAFGMSYVAFCQGRYEEAGRQALRAHAGFVDVGNVLGQATALDSAASAALMRGDMDAARAHLERCRELGRVVGSRLVEGFAAIWGAEIDASCDDPAGARAGFERAVALGDELGDRTLEDLARVHLAQHHVEQGALAAARDALGPLAQVPRPPGLTVPEWLVGALLAAAGAASADGLVVSEKGAFDHRVVAHLCLHRATHARVHLAAARALVDGCAAQIDLSHRAAFWASSPLVRFLGEPS